MACLSITASHVHTVLSADGVVGEQTNHITARMEQAPLALATTKKYSVRVIAERALEAKTTVFG